MTAVLLDDLPAVLRRSIASAGYQLDRWAAARTVLQSRVLKGRLPAALQAFLERWMMPVPAGGPLVVFGETAKGWRLLEGGLSSVPRERALLHLPALRRFWTQELRQAHFDALRSLVGRAWLMDDSPMPAGAVVEGLGISSWMELAGKSGLDRFEVVHMVTGAVSAVPEHLAAIIAGRQHLLVERMVAVHKMSARFGRDESGKIVLKGVEGLS